MHLGSLESTREARMALGYRLEQLLRRVSVCIHYCRENNIFPRANNGRSCEKKKLFVIANREVIQANLDTIRLRTCRQYSY